MDGGETGHPNQNPAGKPHGKWADTHADSLHAFLIPVSAGHRATEILQLRSVLAATDPKGTDILPFVASDDESSAPDEFLARVGGGTRRKCSSCRAASHVQHSSRRPSA